MSALLQRLRAQACRLMVYRISDHDAPFQMQRDVILLLKEAADWIEARERDDAARTAKQPVNPFKELV